MLRHLRTVLPLCPVLVILLLSAGAAAGQTAAEPGDGHNANGTHAPAPGQDAAPDVRFMQGMIHHHAQAVRMSALVPDRSTDGRLHLIAERIDVSQRDEIAWMAQWLKRHGAAAPDVPLAPGVHGGTAGEDRGHDLGEGQGGHAEAHGGEGNGHPGGDDGRLSDDELMPGMLTAEQMSRLEAGEGVAFDRLFLEYMIFHHEGALVMVDDLLASEGGGEAPEVFRFASDVAADQQAEIRRMQGLLDALSGG